MLVLPSQRSPYGRPPSKALLVVGSADAVGDAVRTAAQAGWETWSVVRQGRERWRVTVARRG